MKYHKILMNLNKPYKRKIHPVPIILGIIGNLLVILATVSGMVPEPFLLSETGGNIIWQAKDIVLISAILGLVFSGISSILPFLCGIGLILLSLMFGSAFLATISILGLIGSGLVFLSGILSMRLRKDLISTFRW